MKLEGCNLSNVQIGNNNTMYNINDQVDWNSLSLLFNDLEKKYKNLEEEKYIIESKKYINRKDKKGIKNFIRNNYEDFFCNVFGNIASSAILQFLKSAFNL